MERVKFGVESRWKRRVNPVKVFVSSVVNMLVRSQVHLLLGAILNFLLFRVRIIVWVSIAVDSLAFVTWLLLVAVLVSNWECISALTRHRIVACRGRVQTILPNFFSVPMFWKLGVRMNSRPYWLVKIVVQVSLRSERALRRIYLIKAIVAASFWVLVVHVGAWSWIVFLLRVWHNAQSFVGIWSFWPF
jgi:hypothetical protein